MITPILLTLAFGGGGLFMKFLLAVLLLAIVGGLMYCIDVFIHPIPGPVKMVIAIIVLIVIIIQFLGESGGL